jgi:ABC-2 type transport system permease protein
VNPRGRRPALFLITRREVLIRLRSRVFTVGTIAMVAGVVIGIWIGSVLLGSPKSTQAVKVGFNGGSAVLEGPFARTAEALGLTVTVSTVADPSTARGQVSAGTLDMAVTGPATAPTAITTDSTPSMAVIALDAAVQSARMAAAGLPPATIVSITAPVAVEQVQPAGTSSRPPTQNVLAGLSVAILLYISLGLYSGLVSQGVVEEKSTRIMEILLATVRPSDLLGGKVLGIGLVAILQLTIVGAAALIAVRVTDLASVPALDPGSIVVYVIWFALGFFLYATAYATLASLVSRQEEVGSATAPITILLVVGYLLVFVAIGDPSRTLVTVLSLVPPFAPILMSVRIAAGVVPLWQIVLAMVLTLAGIVALVWFAGRIYANVAMRTGARVSFRDALRG